MSACESNGPGVRCGSGRCRGKCSDIKISNNGNRSQADSRRCTACGETPKAIATILDREGFRPPKRASRFTAGIVRRLLHELGLRPRVPRRTAAARPVAGRGVVARPGADPGPVAAHVARVAKEGLAALAPVGRAWRPMGGVGRRDRTGPPAGVEGMPPTLESSGAAGPIANARAAWRLISFIRTGGGRDDVRGYPVISDSRKLLPGQELHRITRQQDMPPCVRPTLPI